MEFDQEAAKKAVIARTPSFVINGYVISGAQPAIELKKLIDQALREAK